MKRNTSIDIAKGIAIILMVIGHCYRKENNILVTIYAFHMPFFFMVSGLLYAEKWKEKVKLNVISSCRKLLIPYLFFDTLFLLFLAILRWPMDLKHDLLAPFLRLVLPLVGATVTWYLPCQLLVVLLSGLVISTRKFQKMEIGGGNFNPHMLCNSYVCSCI